MFGIIRPNGVWRYNKKAKLLHALVSGPFHDLGVGIVVGSDCYLEHGSGSVGFTDETIDGQLSRRRLVIAVSGVMFWSASQRNE